MNQEKIITIVIADSHHLLGQGIKCILEKYADMKVVGETNNGVEIIKMIEKFKPDVLLMDNRLSEGHDHECAKRITSSGKTKVIILSNSTNENYALRLLKLGASGYLLKQCEPDEVAIAIRTVYRGKVYLDKKILKDIPGNLSFKQSKEECNQLTPRESEVLSHIASGYSIKEIAKFFCIEYGTVMTHKKRIRQKFNLNNDVELTKFAIRNGLATLN